MPRRHAFSAKTCRAMRRHVVVPTLAIASFLGAQLAHGAESWEILLRQQLKDQQRCELAEVLFVREMPVGNVVGLMGRARCKDTREFDFQRENANQKFTIRLCEPVAVC